MYESFNQPAPELGNQYDDDRVLRSYLRRVLPGDLLAQAEPGLRELGSLAGGQLYRMQLADRRSEPALTQWDAWGARIDQIEVSPLWRLAERLAAEWGVVASAYDPALGRHARPYQFALAYLFHPSTDVYTCPLAMTDGAARTLLRSGNQELIARAVPRLTSRDPQQLWTSGQWMTESTGGSDVGRSETVARRDESGAWRLYGRKWFTSATTSQMALTLARPEGNGPGGQGLALFYVETRDAEGRLRNIRVNRLKEKLGTRKVPTAELSLEGAPATPVLGLSEGVKAIVPMLQITRTWNSITAAAFMRRGIALARDYARRRVAFGAALAHQPLHQETLADLQAESEAAFHLSFFLTELLGASEAGAARPDEQALLRVLSSIAKLTTARQAVAAASETLESFGGAGYIEDTGLPTLLRDSQVLPIWEGTTNVLALDAMRALADPACWEALAATVEQLAQAGRERRLADAGRTARTALLRARRWHGEAASQSRASLERGARACALTIGRSLALALLVRQAQWSLDAEQDGRARAAALRFASAGVDLLDRHLPDADLAAALANDELLPTNPEVLL
jgi:alkylation response protein AidB-like acyl-CoA dehydrogenase